jgi:hypothetical protein
MGTTNLDTLALSGSLAADAGISAGTALSGATVASTATVTAGTALRGKRVDSMPTPSALGAVATHIGATTTEGWEDVIMEETLAPAAVATNMTTPVPKGAVITAVAANVQTALTGGGTTVTWSLGTAADPDKYGTAGHPTQADSLAKNSHSEFACAPLARLAADETITLRGAATGGAADGNTALTVGTVRVVVHYKRLVALTAAP